MKTTKRSNEKRSSKSLKKVRRTQEIGQDRLIARLVEKATIKRGSKNELGNPTTAYATVNRVH